jgi:quinol monooxygenase YgiN
LSKHVLIVDLEIKPEAVDAFKIAARKQAEQSLALEVGCHHFQIVQSADQENKFTNYEIFENAAAFETHANMPHTAVFKQFVESVIVNMEMRQGELLK